MNGNKILRMIAVVAQIATGIVFIFSGFVKAVDLLDSTNSIPEYHAIKETILK